MIDLNDWPYNIHGQQLQDLLTKQAPVHVTKVNGRNGAEAFSMPPNSDAILLDTSQAVVWLAQTDGAGYKTLLPYDISPHKEITPQDQYNSLENRIAKLEETIHGLQSNTSGSNWSNNSKQQRNDAGNRSNASG